ncbi:hypothetical protein [Clostridium cellulovorans]|uniref:Uncharacterized protein n=1 Tax=Clostridium cellulovorans (strain ATCC 35296 / DSM 3052 / OCM 3 / 743B) TaxID=573061 RepID=D9SVY4_CLOC7|nr:hypothetical protein [Clostridium cellulovorans]ADL53195.1 hypothetical protein Clocel_3519 [Clostridium cellulovorans 743B]
MDNYEAVAYAVVAIKELDIEGQEVNEITLKGRMLKLMDKYSEEEIYKKHIGNN